MIREIVRQATRPTGPLLSQAVGQIAGLAAQLALLSQLGGARFAAVGLALIVAQTVAFVGEAGFTRALIAASARADPGQELWRAAIGRRLALLAALAPAAIAGWAALRGLDAGLVTLVAALPGIVMSAWDPDPCLNGSGQRTAAGRALLLRWTVYAAGLLAAGGLSAVGHWSEALAGAAFSAGWAVAWVFARRHGLAVAPRWSRRLPDRGPAYLWCGGILGAIFGAALPFAVEAREPAIAAAVILAVQVLNGLAALGGRIDRLVLPALVGGGDPRGLRDLWAAATAAAASVLATAALLSGDDRLAIVGLLLLAEWQVAVTGGFEISLLVMLGRERQYWWGSVAMTGPVLAAHFLPADLLSLAPLLWLRIAAVTGLWLWIARVTGCRLTAPAALAVSGTFALAALAPILPMLAAVLGAALAVLWSVSALCLRGRRAA